MTTTSLQGNAERCAEMALLVLLMVLKIVVASNIGGEMALANVTRFAAGDLFSLIGSNCGPTRCMEVSHGTALAALGSGNDCLCQCRSDTPAFREDQKICVNHIDECLMASFGRGSTKLQIPFVFLPLKGQIIYPSKEIIFTDVEDAICAVTSAQYLSSSGWVTLRDLVDNDVPFSLYRDEGSTFLQWRGSAALHARLEGRLVAAHVLCSASKPTRPPTSCAAFRIAGSSHNPLLDVRSITFHAGETVTTEPSAQNQGLSVLESLAIGVCVLMLIFVYAAGIIFYVHYKQKQKRKEKDPELNLSNTISTDNESTLDSRIDMENMRLKTNPLLKMESLGNDFMNDPGLSDVSEHTEDTIDSSPNHTQKFQKINSNVVSAMVHTRRKKPSRPMARATSTPERIIERLQRRSASPDTFERAPHSDLSIVDCSIENNSAANKLPPPSTGEPAIRKKLYFNPIFFESEHLKNPPPAAIDFLLKIREVMSIAKEKMMSKRFIPILSDIPEEELYHTIDLGWDIPCARRGRRFSAISLKRENSRKVHCGGCPGCDNGDRGNKVTALSRSNSCKTCVSDDYKQKIVRKWLDEVPLPHSASKPTKSVAKVSGTPRNPEQKIRDNICLNPSESVNNEIPRKLGVTQSLHKEKNIEPQVEDKIIKKDKIVEDLKISRKNIESNENDTQEDILILNNDTIETKEKRVTNHMTRRIRKKLPPPPPPPISPENKETQDDVEPMPLEVKIKMEAVIRELNKCRRVEPKELDDINLEYITPIAPKIVIPVLAADSHYYSDDNLLSDTRKRDVYLQRENLADMDSLERNILRRRRFSLDCGPELVQRENIEYLQNLKVARDRLSRSWRDVKKAVDSYDLKSNTDKEEFSNGNLSMSGVLINSIEPVYNNMPVPGSLTIEVRGSPIENRRNSKEEFDPDTLDRKPKRESKKRVEKILLKSGGSFKHKSTPNECEETTKQVDEDPFTRKIGSLRQIYEAKTKAQDDGMRFGLYERRGSVPYGTPELAAFVNSVKTPDLIRQIEEHKDKPPIPPKQRVSSDMSPKFFNISLDNPNGEKRRLSEERDRFPGYSRVENLNARRSGRRSARTRSRRTDLKKLYKTEDSGYLSTDSNESKRRARYLMQMRPKIPQEPIIMQSSVVTKTSLQIESDTDELESLCDGRSESGGESVETDSVFFGNFNDSKQLLAELGLNSFEAKDNIEIHEQIDSGFAGETNIILSGDSDSEHRSVISIVAGRDGRMSAASIAKLDDPPYVHSLEC